MTFVWDDGRVCAFDFETSGTRPEYALQPWRCAAGDFWATSLVWLWPHGQKLKWAGAYNHRDAPNNLTRDVILDFVEWAAETERVVCGWNLAYDIAVLLAHDIDFELIRSIRWLDGMLLWRHADIEPEYDETGPKQPFGLKEYVRRHLPQYAGYEEDVNFHDDSPEARAKLHDYNIQDNVFTLRACKTLWHRLAPSQQRAAWIEAGCLPRVALRNLRGLLIDTLVANDMALVLEAKAGSMLAKLGPDVVGRSAYAAVKGPKRKPFTEQQTIEKVVRSPQLLGKLLFDDWALPVHHNTATGARSTDRETLHELAASDPRARELREYREALNCRKKFALGPIAAAVYNGDSRARPQAKVFGTYSGRFTYASKQKRGKHNEIEEAGDDE